MPVLTYVIETTIWKEKEKFKIRAVQMDNLRGLLHIRRMDSSECMDKAVVWSDEEVKKRGLDVRQAMGMVHDRSIIIIIWGVSCSRQHSRRYNTAEDKDELKIRHKA